MSDLKRDYISLSYAELKKECIDRNLESKGKKNDLIEKLKKYDSK